MSDHAGRQTVPITIDGREFEVEPGRHETAGDRRFPLTGPHAAARKTREERAARRARPAVRLRQQLSAFADWLAAL